MNHRLEQILSKGLIQVAKVVQVVVPMRPPLVFVGVDSSLQLAVSIAQKGHKRVLIVTDPALEKLGLLEKLKSTLDSHGVENIVYDGVLPDPTYQQVENGLSLVRQHGCDGILAFGGGSSMDAAKVIAALATNEGKSIDDLVGMFKVRNACLPLYAVPTTAGTGSEATIAAVISNTELQQKMQILDNKLITLSVALDPALMTGLPKPITAATGMDALTHALESYISLLATKDTDEQAEAAVKLIFDNLRTAYNDGSNLEARQAMAMASFYAGQAFTKANLGYVHAIAHNLGAMYHIPHGLANATVLPHILDFSHDAVSARLAQLAVRTGIGKASNSDWQNSSRLISEVKQLIKDVEIPATLDKLKAEDVSTLATAAIDEARFHYAVPKFMLQQDCEGVIRKLLPSYS
ncbi:MAG: iron-containing alcohol dehydrogenase [Pseudomonadales bacterium]|nr:iron-containing alcohol dehydrogenase [Pseudomonadales bacterium]